MDSYEIKDQNSYSYTPEAVPPTVGEWFITILLCTTPGINIVCLIYWAFFSNKGPVKENFAKAMIIIVLIEIVLAVILATVFTAMMASVLSAIN